MGRPDLAGRVVEHDPRPRSGRYDRRLGNQAKEEGTDMAETKPSPPRHDPRVVAAPRTIPCTTSDALDRAALGSARAGMWPLTTPAPDEAPTPRSVGGGSTGSVDSPGVATRARHGVRSGAASTSDSPVAGSPGGTEVVPT
ncbi:hypothetical protein ACFXGA_36795 [Actinosynnema sp. NPDC059335]|uniref:hypothetical protein n=1 Tax=Actinosynnema sp. NPDC059335 TaxID=3346804 RepID=UPI003670FB94